MFKKAQDLKGYNPGEASASERKKVRQAADQSARRVADHTAAWAGPQLRRAKHATVAATAPGAAKAAESLAPKMDAAHDAIIDEILPAIARATERALNATASATDSARDASVSALGKLAVTAGGAAAVAKPLSKKEAKKAKKARKKAAKEAQAFAKVAHKEHRKAMKSEKRELRRAQGGGAGKTLLTIGLLGAAAGAGYYAWKKTQPKTDPWVAATGTDYTAAPAPATAAGTDATLGAYTTTTAAPKQSSASVPPKAVDLTQDIDHTVGGMSEAKDHREEG